VWRVAIDGGAEPKPATEEEITKSKASVSVACPPDAP
jgi:hypothetical protein